MGRVLAAAALAVALTACSPADDPNEIDDGNPLLQEHRITLQDGSTLRCVTYSSLRKGGLSCDWDGVR